MKTIYYVRHGQSQANLDSVTAGSELDSPLTDVGRVQAIKTGQMLKDKAIQLIVSSPLIRAKETAAIIASEIGYDVAKIIESPLFTERSVGYYSNRPHSLYREAAMNGTLDKSTETTAAMYKRVQQGFQWLQSLDADRILLVGHGGTGRTVQAIQKNMHHSKIYELDEIPNSSVFEFRLQ